MRRLWMTTATSVTLAVLAGVTGAHVSQLFAPDNQNANSSILDQKTPSPVVVSPGNVGPPADSDGLEFERRLVKGSPFSAVLLIETVRFLPDGTSSVRSFSSLIYRDDRGRIRRDQMPSQVPPGADSDQPQRTNISDPVAGFTYILEHNARVAQRATLVLLSEPGSTGSQKTEVRLARARGQLGTSEILPLGPVGESGQSLERTATAPLLPETRREMLGQREIGGVTTEGSRVAMTIRSSASGNGQPMEIVTERWYSPALQIVVLLTQSDPRIGEITYRLTEIKRGEPAARLFAVPAEYKIIE